MLEIEKGIPMPDKKYGRHLKYPFKEMEITDSFIVECKKDESHQKLVNILSSARHYKPMKFRTETVETGIRCWRIE